MKNLEDALVLFKEAHSEVLSQLISKVQKDKCVEDKEAAITQMITEDEESSKVEQLLEEAETIVRKLKVFLAIQEEREAKELEWKLKLEQIRQERIENDRRREAALDADKKVAEARAEEHGREEVERQRRELEHLDKVQRLKEEAEEIRLKEDERRRQEKHEGELRIAERNAEAQRNLWEQDPQFQRPAMATAVVPAPGRPADATLMQTQSRELFKILNDQLPRFDGDLSKAADFVLYFEELVHKRADLSDAAKFAILYSHLVDGSIAKRCLE